VQPDEGPGRSATEIGAPQALKYTSSPSHVPLPPESSPEPLVPGHSPSLSQYVLHGAARQSTVENDSPPGRQASAAWHASRVAGISVRKTLFGPPGHSSSPRPLTCGNVAAVNRSTVTNVRVIE